MNNPATDTFDPHQPFDPLEAEIADLRELVALLRQVNEEQLERIAELDAALDDAYVRGYVAGREPA
jgi:hypothetical protein